MAQHQYNGDEGRGTRKAQDRQTGEGRRAGEGESWAARTQVLPWVLAVDTLVAKGWERIGARATETMASERNLKVPARHKTAPVQTHRRRLRILVIDDLADEAESLAELVGLWGHKAHIALNGIDGLVAANDFRPEVVLCDLVMPGIIDGCKVAESLRRHAALSGVLLVAVTAHNDNEHRRDAARAGFHAYVVKPVDPEQLQRLLNGY